ncbi:ras-related protein Rab-17 isoform X1 [Equus przewalskii]|uniref:Ras-related protein Rab-17 n=3 Tax=Equus TaxID=9789 RepID=A0A9L0TT88_HORSE|nr:ras-related protein Rab-17 isoform X1 [Equus caballus]XP_008505240.1 PREDICTED: ras-related protein Rab-17 [Equus przewalskii]
MHLALRPGGRRFDLGAEGWAPSWPGAAASYLFSPPVPTAVATAPACLWREAKFSQARRREKGDRELPCGTQNAQQSGSLEVSRPGEHGMAQVAGASCPRAAPGQPFVFKLVLLGSGSVGKSSLALRYVKNDFRSTLPTVGCAFFTKVVDLGAASLKLEIWDTAGQEKYHSVCHLYFRGANAALLVYDITRKDSFDMVQQWLKDLEKEFHPGEIVVMLVGNKTDLGEEREVTFEEGKEFAESKRLLFMETSARLNHQVTEVFSAVARELLQREERKEGQTQRRDARLALNERPAGQAKCCAR